MPLSDTAKALQSRLSDTLQSYVGTEGKSAPSSPANPSTALRAKRTIQTRRTLYGEKTMSRQSLSSLAEARKAKEEANT